MNVLFACPFHRSLLLLLPLGRKGEGESYVGYKNIYARAELQIIKAKLFYYFLVDELKKKWKNKRDAYMKKLKEISISKKSGSGATSVPKMEFFQELSFLKKHIEDRRYAS